MARSRNHKRESCISRREKKICFTVVHIKRKTNIRARARRAMKCSTGKEVDHKGGNPKNTNRSNLKCVNLERVNPALKVHVGLTLRNDLPLLP